MSDEPLANATVPGILEYLQKLSVALFPGAMTGPPRWKDERGREYVTHIFVGATPAQAAIQMQAKLNELKQHGHADAVFRLEPWFQLYEEHRQWRCRTRIATTQEN